MKQTVILILVVATGIFLLSCRTESKKEKQADSVSTSGSLFETNAPNTSFEGTGIVLSITPNKKQIIIKHNVIPGFMDAMTMPFNVSDSLMLEGVFPKDSVKIFIDYDGTNVVLKDIRKGY